MKKNTSLLVCLLMVFLLPGCQKEIPKKELVRPVWAMKSLSIKIKKRDLLFQY